MKTARVHRASPSRLRRHHCPGFRSTANVQCAGAASTARYSPATKSPNQGNDTVASNPCVFPGSLICVIVISHAANSEPLKISRRLSASKRSEEHKSELQSLMRISYAVLCLKNKQTEIKKYNDKS